MAKLKRIENKRNFLAQAPVDSREWRSFIAEITPEIERLVENRLGLFHYRPKLKALNLPTKNYQKIAS
jgi:hypothetical protein